MYRNPAWQKGIGLPAAVFVITLMAAIAVAINALVSQNAQTFEEELRLTRAFYAAETGAAFGMNILFPPQDFPSYTTAAACPAVEREYEFTVDGLTACSVAFACVEDADVDGARYYTITSTGTCGEVSRTVQVRTSHSD
jgi:MSHA biogenesis protein MshP